MPLVAVADVVLAVKMRMTVVVVKAAARKRKLVFL